MSREEREGGEGICPLHPVVPPAKAAANVSPSPGGEGRDEGGLLTIMNFLQTPFALCATNSRIPVSSVFNS
jgi:hypothetical protein